VVELQTLLNKGPSSFPKLKTDGSFGPTTLARVVEFQRSKGLIPDGVVGPNTWAALGSLPQGGGGAAPGAGSSAGAAPPPSSPAGEQAARDKIVAFAVQQYQQFGWHSNTTLSPSNPRIAGKRCADPPTRRRQGGPQLFDIFTVAGGPNPSRCLTLSPQAEAMYAQGDPPAAVRNNIDIVSWCGIFALYCHKKSGLRMSSWPLRFSIGKQKPGDELRLRRPGEPPQPGDIGIVNPSTRNHHFVVTAVSGNAVSSIDGNAGFLMEIVRKDGQYGVAQVLASGGGFLTPVWENVL
jgi:hypothetical protein